MKYLKIFEEWTKESQNTKQLIEIKDGKECLSKIYDIADTVFLSDNFCDFLVDYEKFIEYAEKYYGMIATNYGQIRNMDDFRLYISEKLIDIGDEIYVAPYWFSRPEGVILNFEDVYTDTVYVKVNRKDVSVEDLKKIEELTKANEVGLFKAESGTIYIRIWWD